MKDSIEILLRVDENHLKDGIPCNCSNCPIALATIEAFQKALSLRTAVKVDESDIYVQVRRGNDPILATYHVKTPHRLEHFIKFFDSDTTSVQPFTTVIDFDKIDMNDYRPKWLHDMDLFEENA